MGSNPKTRVTKQWAQTHDVPNLNICDASIFPSSTDKTTTMPIVAFTMRTCDHMLSNFKAGVHKRALNDQRRLRFSPVKNDRGGA